MLKYVETAIAFSEVPDEITLCINISNCPCACEGCHSAYLAEDIGELLTESELKRLILQNEGITCVAFMGGDKEPYWVNRLAEAIKDADLNIKTAWYSGRQELSKNINLSNFDFIKVGPYLKEYGPLTSKTTNQKFYKVVHTSTRVNKLYDMTYKFYKYEAKD